MLAPGQLSSPAPHERNAPLQCLFLIAWVTER